MTTRLSLTDVSTCHAPLINGNRTIGSLPLPLAKKIAEYLSDYREFVAWQNLCQRVCHSRHPLFDPLSVKHTPSINIFFTIVVQNRNLPQTKAIMKTGLLDSSPPFVDKKVHEMACLLRAYHGDPAIVPLLIQRENAKAISSALIAMMCGGQWELALELIKNLNALICCASESFIDASLIAIEFGNGEFGEEIAKKIHFFYKNDHALVCFTRMFPHLNLGKEKDGELLSVTSTRPIELSRGSLTLLCFGHPDLFIHLLDAYPISQAGFWELLNSPSPYYFQQWKVVLAICKNIKKWKNFFKELKGLECPMKGIKSILPWHKYAYINLSQITYYPKEGIANYIKLIKYYAAKGSLQCLSRVFTSPKFIKMDANNQLDQIIATLESI